MNIKSGFNSNLDSGEAGEDGANLVENKNKEAEAGSIIQRDAERIHKQGNEKKATHMENFAY